MGVGGLGVAYSKREKHVCQKLMERARLLASRWLAGGHVTHTHTQRGAGARNEGEETDDTYKCAQGTVNGRVTHARRRRRRRREAA